jgi:membrane protein DedA with SNARE-associated domain
MEEFLQEWGYLGIFVGILLTGIGFPMPEELPVVLGGALAGHGSATWWIMLPVCIVGVVIGDSFLYLIGRLWGPRLLQYNWVKTKLLPPERLAKIEHNFQQHGIKILLFARMTPGIRAPIFFTAGLTRLSLLRFLVADGIYAVPGVSLLFFLGYWFTEGMVNLIKNDIEHVKSIIIIAVILAVIVYVVYRFLRKPMVTGAPEEMPPIVDQVTHTLEGVATKIMHPRGGPRPADKTMIMDPGLNGQPPNEPLKDLDALTRGTPTPPPQTPPTHGSH